MKQSEEQLFSWLELQDMNVVVIIVLLLVVTGFSMISALLILILEKTGMIGTLKALGSADHSIEKIFLFNAYYIIGAGLFYGNIIGIGLSLLQSHFSLIPLPEESYYVSTIPIELSWPVVIGLNIASFAFCIVWVLIAGWATATECAAYGVLGSLAIAAWGRSLTWENFKASLMGATRVSCMITRITPVKAIRFK